VSKGKWIRKETGVNHVRFCDSKGLYIAEPVGQLEAPHHVYSHTAAKWARVSARDVADVEHGRAEKSHDL
jgi:hypothetical protein